MFPLVSKASDDAIAIFEKRDHRHFHVHLDALVDAVILQRSYQLKPGAIADVCETRVAVASKISLKYLAVFRPIENRTPGF